MSEETEVATNPIEDMIQATLDQNYTAAAEIFNDQIGLKMQDALEQEKMGIASRIYAGADGNAEDDDYVVADPDAEDVEDEELDIDDEDLDIDDEDLEVDEDEDEEYDEDDEVEN